MSETFTVGWGTRCLGLAVLIGVSLVGARLLFESGTMPVWTALLLGGFGLASAVASISNFGDVYTVSEDGLSFRNVLTAKVGRPRERHVKWDEVVDAKSYESRTWFINVDGQKRWVLDQLKDHHRFGLMLQQYGVSVTEVEKPKLWKRDPSDPA